MNYFSKMEVPKRGSIVLFYNQNGEILIQDRRKISKWGEEYAFFGGGVEDGESHDETIRREINEELGLENISLDFYRRYDHRDEKLDVTVDMAIYLSKGIPDLSKIVCTEGSPEVRTFENCSTLKLLPGFNALIDEIHDYLISKGELQR